MGNKFGSVYEQIVAKTSNYTVADADDLILIDASGGAVTVTLPTPIGRSPLTSPIGAGRVRVVKTDASSFPVTISAAAGSIVGGSVLRQQGQSMEFVSDGVGSWYNIAPQQTVFIAEISLTAAQVKAIRATPITLVQAQGAGTIVRLLGAELLLDYGGSNVFTESTNNLAIRYTDGSGVVVSGTIETTGFIDQSADTATGAIPVIDGIVAKAGVENKGLVLHNTSGAEIAGNAANDNVVRVKVWYSVISTGW
ncbi:MAG TPA: hypothetical protein VFS27_06210 [Blastocatellia bacterium]|jgi:hypothetical protein|nr:hypothetical protein [Blastocatellia bacterium]